MIHTDTAPGTKIVCISNRPLRDGFWMGPACPELTEGAVYTVHRWRHLFAGVFALVLREAVQENRRGESCYAPSRFRLADLPLCLTGLLDTGPVQPRVVQDFDSFFFRGGEDE